MSAKIQSLPAFSDSISQPSLPTEFSTLPDFTGLQGADSIIDSGSLDDLGDLALGLNIDLGDIDGDLGLQLDTSLPDPTAPPGGSEVLSSGVVGDLDLNLNLDLEIPDTTGLPPVVVKKEPVQDSPKPLPKLPEQSDNLMEPAALNIDNINIPSVNSSYKPPETQPPTTKMSDWTNAEVEQWLMSKTFGHLYVENFRKHNVVGEDLLKLEENFMIVELGISKVFHRIRILRDIADFLQPFQVNKGDAGPPYSRFLRFQPYDVMEWCKLLSFTSNTNHPELFQSQNITGEILAQQSVDTLKSWGIKNLHAKRFLREIEDVRNGVPEPCKRVETTWGSDVRTDPCYKLLYKHLKPRLRRSRGRKRKVRNPDSPENWQVDEVIYWLDNFSWGQQYVEAFRACEVNGPVLLRLTAQLLGEYFNITNPQQQSEMVSRIDELRGISLRGWMREPQVLQFMGQRQAKRPKISDDVSPTVQPACVLCGKQDNIMRCSKCKKAFYCSREHQVQHWPDHAAVCIPCD